jgi:predicted ATPase
LAHTLNLRLHGRRSTREQLLDYLRPRELLLLLDNVETALAESRSLIQELLQSAPDVRLLLTSREPLGIHAEELLVLDQLPVPGVETLDLAAYEEEQYASLQLFVERARRTFASFTLDQENLADIARICRLVGGIPLAIELAAAWVGHFNSAEIAEAIERNPGFLHSPLHGRPARHQSMTSVFNYSWELLVSHERRVLVQLAVFRGSFSREAAQAVAGAPLPILMSLVNKSMLRLTQPGRYELHELVRRFAETKWAEMMGRDSRAEAERRELQLRYGRYYLNFMAAQAGALQGPAPEKAIRAAQANLDNIHRAWEMMLALEQDDLIVQSASGLSGFYHFAGQHRAAARLFALAADKLLRRSEVGDVTAAEARAGLLRLQSGHEQLAQQAAGVEGEVQHRLFPEQAPAHRAIVAALEG